MENTEERRFTFSSILFLTYLISLITFICPALSCKHKKWNMYDRVFIYIYSGGFFFFFANGNVSNKSVARAKLLIYFVFVLFRQTKEARRYYSFFVSSNCPKGPAVTHTRTCVRTCRVLTCSSVILHVKIRKLHLWLKPCFHMCVCVRERGTVCVNCVWSVGLKWINCTWHRKKIHF